MVEKQGSEVTNFTVTWIFVQITLWTKWQRLIIVVILLTGLLNVGDVLQEINGAKVGEDPLEVQKQLVCFYWIIPVKVECPPN